MKQGSSHRRIVSENQDHSTLGKEAWTTNQQHGRPLLVGDKSTVIIIKVKEMAENIFANGIAEIFETKNQNTEAILVNNEVLNKIANKMEDMDYLIEVTVSTTSKNLPIMETRFSKGQGSTSEWTHATEEVILNTIKAFRTKNPEPLKGEDEIKVEAITYNLQTELTEALIANKCRYSYVVYKNREEVDCYIVTFYLSKNRRFKVSLTKDADTTKLINA